MAPPFYAKSHNQLSACVAGVRLQSEFGVRLNMIEFFSGFLGAGIGASLIGFLAKNWLSLRIKTAIENETFTQRSAFEIKRSACLDALAVVDAAYSQTEWIQDEKKIDIAKQPLAISDARKAYNQLAITCSDPTVVELYAQALGLHSPDETPPKKTADLIVDLRNSMRKELGFGTSLNFDRNKAWIGNLDGAT